MAIIFWDYDGVLVDTLEIDRKYYLAACKEAGIDQIQTCEDLITLSQGNFYEECYKIGIDAHKIEVVTDIFEKMMQELECEIPTFPGMPEVVAETAQRFPSFIITSNTSTIVASMLKKLQIIGVRDILGCDKEKSKVKKIQYAKALFPGEKTYFIGDTSGDIFEAKVGGVDVTIGVSWGWHTAEVLNQANPDYVFNAVSELKEFLYSLAERTIE